MTAGCYAPPRSSAAPFRDSIVEKLDQGLTVQRVFQDLQEEYGYAHSYESVKRYVRKLGRRRGAVGVMHSVPGEEAQCDFFQGTPTLDGRSGQWRRPWVFRRTLCHSRHGYEEAVWDQKLATFLRLHENAFHDFGGVPRVVRHDSMKAAVVRACLFDPDVHPVYAAFGEHWALASLPTRPRNPQENGKQERSGGYVKDNALKGITRLTAEWDGEYQIFRKSSLAEKDYVYVWVDGIHFNVRLEDDRLCTLVMIGTRPDGTKELIAVEDGYRESTESWASLLRDLKRRGMRAPLVAVGDGALGFWAAVSEVWPETRHARDWCHKLGNVLDKLPKRLQPRAGDVRRHARTRSRGDGTLRRGVRGQVSESGRVSPRR